MRASPWFCLTVVFVVASRGLHSVQARPSYPPNYKRILLWSPKDSTHPWPFQDGQQEFLDRKCPETRCYFTSNQSEAPVSHSVLFNAQELSKDIYLLRKQRSANQTWVFVSTVPPPVVWKEGGPKPRSFDSLFNWTLTYKHDSDIPAPAGTYVRRSQKLSRSDPDYYRNYGKEKADYILWHSKDCSWQDSPYTYLLTDYVNDVLDYAPVHLATPCHKNTRYCAGLNPPNQCLVGDVNPSAYKFHLAFEREGCKEYITDVFWDALRADSLPIAFGPSLQEYKILVPPNSFLHVHNFTDFDWLTDHTGYLNQYNEEYNRYFEWKRRYKISSPQGLTGQAICSLCQRLHDPRIRPKSYKISEWFGIEENCDYYNNKEDYDKRQKFWEDSPEEE